MREEKIKKQIIPKKIHYCWLSGEPLPKDIQKCMQTWRNKMPDYELVLWDRNRFDINSVDFVREACEVKKWAFAADYIRAYALYTEGGIYLDSDVIVRKPFDDFLKYDFFTAIEYSPNIVRKHNYKKLLQTDGTPKDDTNMAIPGIALQAAIMGSQKGHPYLKDILNWYKMHHFTEGNYNKKIIAPNVYAYIAQKYGFVYRNELQKLSNNMLIFPADVFAPNTSEVTENSYAVHCGKDSWRSLPYKLFFKKLATSNFLRKITNRKPLKSIDDILIKNV